MVIYDRATCLLGLRAGQLIAGQRSHSVYKQIEIDSLFADYDPLTAEVIFSDTASFKIGYSGQPIYYKDGHLIIEDTMSGGGEIIEIVSDTILFEGGKTNVQLTGGWDYTGYTFSGFTNNGIGRWNESMMTVESVIESDCCIIGTVNKVDLTNYKSVVMSNSSYTLPDGDGDPSLRISSSKDLTNPVKVVEPGESPTVLDISDLSGEYYIAVMVYGTGVLMGVSKLYLELNDTSSQEGVVDE